MNIVTEIQSHFTQTMDKRIVDKYVRKMATEDIEHLVNVLHIALNGDAKQSKSLILKLLLKEPKWKKI